MEKKKHQHAEAFMHMLYIGKEERKSVCITVWNSRDGVTPFITYCKEYDLQLQHARWQSDKYDPTYKPKKGDLIWRDLSVDQAAMYAGMRFDQYSEFHDKWMAMSEVEQLKNPNHPGQFFQAHRDAGREAWIADAIANTEPGEPYLELVKEDWP